MVPVTHFGKVQRRGFHHCGIVLSTNFGESEREEEREDHKTLLPFLSKSKPHTVHTAAGRLKTFYCLMSNRGLLDMGNLKIKCNS